MNLSVGITSYIHEKGSFHYNEAYSLARLPLTVLVPVVMDSKHIGAIRAEGCSDPTLDPLFKLQGVGSVAQWEESL